MSDEDRDIDVESDEDDTDLGLPGMAGDYDLDNPDITQFMTQSEKRAHHNALERRRRDHIKDSFHSLRDSVPTLQGEKVSRAQILKKASDYIQHMRRKNHCHQTDIDGLKKHNRILENQVRGLEKARATGHFAAATSALNAKGDMVSAFDGGSDSESSDLEISTERPVKKQKTYS